MAFGRDQGNRVPVVIANLAIGWTGIGWVLALVWAAAGSATNVPKRSGERDDGGAPKTCPKCAEPVRSTTPTCRLCEHEFTGENDNGLLAAA